MNCAKNPCDITDSESVLMRLIWTEGDLSTRHIIELTRREHDWSESTVKTLLRRLVKKGALQTLPNPDGRGFLYHATVTETNAMTDRADSLFTSLCASKKGGVILHLVETQPLSRADIRDLQAALEAKAVGAPETVPCDCMTRSCACGEGQNG
ncbi:MAG: CopY/TcrY family copper transport repressor [Aeriscardovia sp.]|nr:CopY/TcrY family copper transport repressor [Aeriscardovia sp.]